MEITDKVERINQQYLKSAGASVSASLKSFLKKEPVSDWLIQALFTGPWLELGCGQRSLFEEGDDLTFGLQKKQDLYGFDLSDVAIERAKAHGRLHYQQVDISEGIPGGPYSFILDGHFLHCLGSFPELFTTLGHILRALKPGGIYAGEVMTIHKNISFDSDLYYDYDTHILYQGDIPIRTLLSAREWEDLFISAGFEISYFVCQASIKMIPTNHRREPMNGDPECLRFVLKRKL